MSMKTIAKKVFPLLASAIIMMSELSAQSGWIDVGKISTGAVRCFCVVSDTAIYAGCDEGGLFRTPDGGQRWYHITSFPSENVYSLARSGMSTLFAGTADGIYRSDNSGASWEGPLPGTGNKAVISILALSDTAFIAGCSRTGMLVSSDRGMKWREMFAGHTVSSLVQRSDGSVYGISDGTKIIFAGQPYDLIEEFPQQLDGNLVVTVLASDGDTLLAGTVRGIFSYSKRAKEWRKIIDAPWITGIVRASDTMLYYTSQTEGFFLWGEGYDPWMKSDRRFLFPVSCIVARGEGNFILGGIDGSAAVSDFRGQPNAVQPPRSKTWANAVVNLALPIDCGFQSDLSVGLSLEIRPVSIVSLEGSFLIGAHVPRKLRFRFYPFTATGLYAGAGNFHFQGYSEQGMFPDYKYKGVDGKEFFIGYRLPRVLGLEVGWRMSSSPWRIHFVGDPHVEVQREELQNLREFYFSAVFNLFNF